MTVNGKPGRLEIRAVEAHSLRLTLRPLEDDPALPFIPALTAGKSASPALVLDTLSRATKTRIGNLDVEVRPDPLRVIIANREGKPVQSLTFDHFGGFAFRKSSEPILGLGEGGPMPERGIDWRRLPVQFDRNGFSHVLVPRWQSNAYGSRNPVPLMIGTEGWALFVAAPWGRIDLREKDRGLFIPTDQEKPVAVQNVENQGLDQGKGLPPAGQYRKGVLDILVFDAHDPAVFLKELSLATGPAVMPPSVVARLYAIAPDAHGRRRR